MISYNLDNRVMVLSGGSGGIGQAIAKLAELSGATVCIWDIQAPAKECIGTYIQCDITSEASVTEAYRQTEKLFGKVDILVNCAGIIGPTAVVGDYPEQAWRRVIDINLIGTFLCCQAVIPAMRERGYGRIVNLSSIAGKEGNANQSAYSASKAAVIGLTKSMGKEPLSAPAASWGATCAQTSCGIRPTLVCPAGTASKPLHNQATGAVTSASASACSVLRNADMGVAMMMRSMPCTACAKGALLTCNRCGNAIPGKYCALLRTACMACTCWASRAHSSTW